MPRETFEHLVGDNGIFVTRNPGPAKKLDPTPRTIASLHHFVTAANDWTAPGTFLRRLAYAGYADSLYTGLNNGTLRRYLPGGLESKELDASQVPDALATFFAADPKLYVEAAEVLRRFTAISS